ncbi:Fructose-2,6-bisphosphatase [Mortierella sp. GBA39]|nr:Fructose-2,6-bisphosphatase [Mortierella sp. GBA39]
MSICRYLQWLGIEAKVFNVGNYRRKLFGTHQPHSFFDPTNPEGERSRNEATNAALKDMIHWFRKDEGTVALFDATNSTKAKRELLLQECERNGVQVMFIESVCEDEAIQLANAIETQTHSPDYEQMEPELALQDFKARTRLFKEKYETIVDRDQAYIKLIDAGSDVIVNRIKGYVQSRVVYYLMNLRIAPRNIYFSRHGESLFNVMGLLGGDSELSARGKQYARALPELLSTHIPNADRLTIWTSTKKRTIATAKHLPNKKLAWQALDELEAGKADALTYEQVEEKFPEDFAKRDNDKYNYRYQDGESYRDVVQRLEPVLMDLERQENVLIIGHQAILRCLYAYFMNHSFERLPYLKIPLHTVIQLTPRAYTCEERRFKVDIEAVDTHRPKPKAGSPAVTKAAAPADPEVQALATAPEPTGRPLTDAEKPKIILSNMKTTTFRDALHPDAASVESRAASPALAQAQVAATAVAPVAPVPAPVPAPAPVSQAPTSIAKPPVEEKAKQIATALMQATAVGSISNPAIALGLNDVNTPIPESALSAPLQSSNNGETTLKSAGGPAAGLSVNSNSTGSVSWKSASTPPMSPVPSIPESMSAAAQAAAEVDDAALSDSQDLDQCCSSPIPGTGSKGVSASSSLEQIAIIAINNKPKKEVAVTVPAVSAVAVETPKQVVVDNKSKKEVAVPAVRQPVAQVATAAFV